MNRIKNLLAALAVVILGTGTLAAQDINDVIDKYNDAVEVYGAKNYAQAIPMLEEVIALGLEVGGDAAELVAGAQKLLPGSYYRIGGANAQQGNWDAAIENFEKAADLADLYGDVNVARNATSWISKSYSAKGADAFNAKDYRTAIEIFESGYEANPNDTDLALNLAKSYGELSETEPEYAQKAYEVYKQIIGLTHSKYAEAVEAAKDEFAYYILSAANTANQNKETEKAYELLDSYLAVNADEPRVNLLYLQIATNQRNWDKVIEKGEAAAAAQTDDALRSDAYFLLGAAYQNKENKAKAIENYRKVTSGNNVSTARQQITALNS